MKDKGLLDERHKDRFKLELKEISAQNMVEYFITAYDEGQKWVENENNLLVAYLLGLVDDFNIDESPVYEHGEFPDIDIDYLPMVRDYLKKEWAPKEFGENNICSIGNYTTFGLKSALIDMARVHSKSRDEILALTTQMGLKDDEGKTLTWDKALEINEGLAQYCKDNPDVAKAANTLVNRRRGMGMHAGGLIVSSSPINNLVPLCQGKDGSHVSAWTEGLHDQDLQPVGLIKFDLLVITDILRIATIVQLVKERHGIECINALPGQSDWTDISYLNDPKALALANIGDTKGIFQFDSDGIRRLLRTGGVTSFDDLVAYSALYRPGPLGMGMDRKFCLRKRGDQEYFLHPLMKPILAPTYGVMVYQEQVMQILNVVGDIPLKDCEVCRKAISKKKLKVITPYKAKFLERGQVNLKVTLDSVKDIWNQIEAFAEYGFNKSHSCAYTYISARLLWLKAHYPMEFYSTTLSLEANIEKVKGYMNDAKFHDIIIQPVDINRSGVNFEIHDDEIYYGLSKVKGIGVEVSKKIVENAPYDGFVDFMNRFGTEARVIQPLLALEAFKDAPKSDLHKFYEVYKDTARKRRDRRRRFEATMERNKEAVCKLTDDYLGPEIWGSWKPAEIVEPFSREDLKSLAEHTEVTLTEIEKVWKKWKRSVEGFYKKERVSDEDDSLSLDIFDPDQHYLGSEFEAVYVSPEKGEELYYGFKWSHPLESSEDYKGLTFEAFQQGVLEKGAIQVIVLHYRTKTSKNNRTYHQLEVEDANSIFVRINIWKDDHAKYGGQEFKAGNLLQLAVEPPQGNFKTYTMQRWGGANKYGKFVPLDKDQDQRVLVMHKPDKEMVDQPVEKTFADVGLIEID
tara:strand:+ start:43921 stop:46482 length:2562 start_codon:yes stop_codon:yes gene_type:complete